MKRSALMVLGLLVCLSSSAIGETEAERAERIRAAAEALNKSKAEAETPAALKAQIAKLEAENRALRAELLKMRAAMKEAGIAVGGAADDGDDDDKRVRSLSTFKQFVSLLPDEVLPQRGERSNRKAWTEPISHAIRNWYFENRDTFNFRKLKVRVYTSPKSTRYQGEDGWYLMGVYSGRKPIENDGSYWVCNFRIYLKPTNDKQRRLILDLKQDDTFTIDAEIPTNDPTGRPIELRWESSGLQLVAMTHRIGANKVVSKVLLRAHLEVTDFR